MLPASASETVRAVGASALLATAAERRAGIGGGRVAALLAYSAAGRLGAAGLDAPAADDLSLRVRTAGGGGGGGGCGGGASACDLCPCFFFFCFL